MKLKKKDKNKAVQGKDINKITSAEDIKKAVGKVTNKDLEKALEKNKNSK